MPIEFLLDESKKEIEKLNKLLKDIGVPSKEDPKTKLLRRLIIEAIKSRQHRIPAEKHELHKIHLRPMMLQPAKRLVPYFKPHEVVKLKRLPEKKKFFNVTEKEYPLLKAGNYTLVRAVVDGEYRIVEPGLTDIDVRIIEDIKTRRLMSDEAIKARVSAILNANIADDYVEKIKYYLARDNMLGKIAFILIDDKVKTITCAGINQAVHVTHNGRDLETDIYYTKLEEINNVVLGLARMAGVNVNNDDPILDTTLSSGNRVQGILGNNIVTPKFVISR